MFIFPVFLNSFTIILKAAVEEREKLEFKVAELKVQVAKGVATEGRGTKRFEKKIRQLEVWPNRQKIAKQKWNFNIRRS